MGLLEILNVNAPQLIFLAELLNFFIWRHKQLVRFALESPVSKFVVKTPFSSLNRTPAKNVKQPNFRLEKI